MRASSKAALLFVALAVVILSPFAAGAFDGLAYAAACIALLVFAAYAFGRPGGRASRRVSLVLVSACLGVTLFDLAARPALLHLYGVRPADRYIRRWPTLPLLQRYEAGVNFEGETYGDLAAVSGRGDWRERRRIRFVTDEYGFRNEPRGDDARPLDLVLLGDSFGVAAGTSQEETLGGVLAREYGLAVYNLSVSRENPRQQYANLLLEGGRLNTREDALVLWLIFPGNDLDEPYHAELEDPRPEAPGLLTRLGVGVGDFRSRSPVRTLLSRGGAGRVIERKLPDGRPVLFDETYARRRGRTAEDVLRHPNFESLKRTLGLMERLAGQRRLRVAVALVPSKEEAYSWVLDGAPPWSSGAGPSGASVVLRGLCERHGFRFLDLRPALVEAARAAYEKSGALLWWRDDTHWNGEGQRVAASAVHANLLREAPHGPNAQTAPPTLSTSRETRGTRR
ncbi:MAG: hypothetical protein LC795_16570 [Acidobacteria bacterium]|nr:hypothetical protein [Acidobacteriota bacterium]